MARWSEDFKRGGSDFDLADPEVVAERAFCNLTGYGPLAPFLDDHDVWDLMVGVIARLFGKADRPRNSDREPPSDNTRSGSGQ